MSMAGRYIDYQYNDSESYVTDPNLTWLFAKTHKT